MIDEPSYAARQAARELRISQERVRLALEGTNTGLWEWDIKADVIHWSDNLGPLHGLPRGAQPADFAEYIERIDPEDRPLLAADVRRAVEQGRGYEREFRTHRPDGEVRWLSARAHVVFDDEGAPALLVGLTTDVTDRHRREADAAFLARAGEALSRSLDPRETLDAITRQAVPALADWCVAQLVADEGELENVAIAHVDPAKVSRARELLERYPNRPEQRFGAPEVIRTGRSELFSDIDDAALESLAEDAEHLEVLRSLHMSSVLVVPLVARGHVLGALSFVSAGSGRIYGERERELAEELGRRAGLAIDHGRLYQREHRTAETLQRALLPERLPDVAGFALTARYLPGVDGDAVGGDWYDAFPLPDGCVGVAMGDVVGRGIKAAAAMGELRNALRAVAHGAPGPSAALDRLHTLYEALGRRTFATVVYLVLDPTDGGVRVACAGHPPPIAIAPGCDAVPLEVARCPPLGAPWPRPAEEDTLVLAPGAALLLYTDGLVEHRDQPLDAGIDAACRAAGGAPDDLEALADHVISEMVAEGGSADDVALLVLRRDADTPHS